MAVWLMSLVSDIGVNMLILKCVNIHIYTLYSLVTFHNWDKFHTEEDYNVFLLMQKVCSQGGRTRGSTSVFPEDSFFRCCWYMCTRRQLLFFTCLPHCGHANGPRSSLCTSRIWMLRFDLLTKSREHSGHLTLRWAVAIHAQLSGEPVAHRKWWISCMSGHTKTYNSHYSSYRKGSKQWYQWCKHSTRSLNKIHTDYLAANRTE